MQKLTILTLTLLLIISCNSSSEMNEELAFESGISLGSTTSDKLENQYLSINAPQNTDTSSPPTKKNKSEKGNKIIKQGQMEIEVENLDSSKNYLDSIVEQNKAYYEKETLLNSDYTQKYSLKLRIPSSNFKALISGLEQGDGKILMKNITAKDVSEEYLDLEIRLENNKAYLKRYKELLSKANSIKDILEIQERIRKIELLIDSNLGRIRFLSDRVEYSTLNVELTTKPEEYIAVAPPSFITKILDAFKSGFSGLLYFILILANLWPIVIGIILIWMFRKKMFAFLKRKKKLQ